MYVPLHYMASCSCSKLCHCNLLDETHSLHKQRNTQPQNEQADGVVDSLHKQSRIRLVPVTPKPILSALNLIRIRLRDCGFSNRGHCSKALTDCCQTVIPRGCMQRTKSYIYIRKHDIFKVCLRKVDASWDEDTDWCWDCNSLLPPIGVEIATACLHQLVLRLQQQHTIRCWPLGVRVLLQCMLCYVYTLLDNPFWVAMFKIGNA
jgi:hypothetical protein